MLKVAPTLLVDEIEPSLAFYTEALGFDKVVDVPGDDGKLAFAMLSQGNVEIHLQTRVGAAQDIPYLAGRGGPPSGFLYIDVKDVHGLFERLKGRVEVLVPLQKTFYGATHFFIKDPGGQVVGFSQNGT